jgi:hypothetical protein
MHLIFQRIFYGINLVFQITPNFGLSGLRNLRAGDDIMKIKVVTVRTGT